jgi:hypothetical protein
VVVGRLLPAVRDQNSTAAIDRFGPRRLVKGARRRAYRQRLSGNCV